MSVIMFFIKSIYLFTFGCAGSSFASAWFSVVAAIGGLFSCGLRASHLGGFSWCGTLVLSHTLSSGGSHRLSYPMTCGVFPDQGSNLSPPCISRQILNHWTAQEVHAIIILSLLLYEAIPCFTPIIFQPSFLPYFILSHLL